MKDNGSGRDSKSLCHFFVYHALDHQSEDIFFPWRELVVFVYLSRLAVLNFVSAYQLYSEQFAHQFFFRERDVQYIEAGFPEFPVRTYGNHRGLILQGLEFVDMHEQYVRVDEKMDEMTV